MANSIQKAGDCPVPKDLPAAFRLTSIERLPAGRGCQNRATLFHEQRPLEVAWHSLQPDPSLCRGRVVAIRWAGPPVLRNGAVNVARLVQLAQPIPTVNLFDMIPDGWVKDRDLVRRGRRLWEALPSAFQHLFNAIFWDGRRFQRYLMGPSSLAGHHNGINGNFRHSVEVAEHALTSAQGRREAFPPILILGALLHDAGKAEEYRFDTVRKIFEMSERGVLVGHKHTILEWLGAARARCPIELPEEHYLALIHALTAARGAPEWLGLRESVSLEALILSMADRLSAQGDLYARLAPDGVGFGNYHRHLKGRPYVVAP